MLSHIARIGGALGFRLIFCTQYPTGDTLPRQVKQNSDAKLGFRLPTQTASSVVIDEPGLESIKAFLDVQFLKRIGLPKYKFLILVMK